MKRILIFCFIMLAPGTHIVSAEQNWIITWSGDATRFYDEGFVDSVMRGSGGVTLFNRELMENDASGAGASEKGVFTDVIWGKNRARKTFHIDDIRAEKAWLVIYLDSPFGRHPLQFIVNGHSAEYKKWNTNEYYMSFYTFEFSAAWLRKGTNTVEIVCSEAQAAQEGWKLLIARADEFEGGGGNPANVGHTSFKSTDGGETWKESRFGPLEQTRAEYTVRISLDRFARTGSIASPVIDLWRGDSDRFYVSQHRLNELTVNMGAEVPDGTQVRYYLRTGTNPSPFSNEWSPYRLVGHGPKLEFTGDVSSTSRYLQLQAVLSSDNPLRSPVFRGARVTAQFTDRFPYPEHKNIYVAAVDNPPLCFMFPPHTKFETTTEHRIYPMNPTNAR